MSKRVKLLTKKTKISFLEIVVVMREIVIDMLKVFKGELTLKSLEKELNYE
jgi:hypothetical protein